MDIKLTLKLNKQIIDRAKQYARQKNLSLSKIIENYLQFLTEEKRKSETISPLVKSLSGVIKLPRDFNPEKEYSSYLENKYK